VIAQEQVLAVVLPSHENGTKKKSNGILNSWARGYSIARDENQVAPLFVLICVHWYVRLEWLKRNEMKRAEKAVSGDGVE
jgi:hypothetical protein